MYRFLVMYGEDDQICPFQTSGARSVKLLKAESSNLIPACRMGMPLSMQTSTY